MLHAWLFDTANHEATIDSLTRGEPYDVRWETADVHLVLSATHERAEPAGSRTPIALTPRPGDG